jgi:hypothetical protein
MSRCLQHELEHRQKVSVKFNRLVLYENDLTLAEKTLATLVKHSFGLGQRIDMLAVIFRLGVSINDLSRVGRLLAWPPLVEAKEAFRRDFVKGQYATETPTYRLVMALVRGSLTGDIDDVEDVARCRVKARCRYLDAVETGQELSVEEYYARFVLWLMRVLYDHGNDAVSWLRRPNVVSLADQVWILYWILRLYHLEENQRIWNAMACSRRLKHAVRKYLCHSVDG